MWNREPSGAIQALDETLGRQITKLGGLCHQLHRLASIRLHAEVLDGTNRKSQTQSPSSFHVSLKTHFRSIG
jgi:hypothetical protein